MGRGIVSTLKIVNINSWNMPIIYLGQSDNHMSLVMRKPAFCICENKDADQLRGNRVADQLLCFR